MSKQQQVKWVDSRRGLALYAGLVLVLAIGCLGAVDAADTAQAVAPQDPGPAAPARRATKSAPGARLEERVKVFAKALDLDATQQSQLRKILLGQGDAVRKIWSDRSLSPAERVPAMQAENRQTGDEIRAILNDEQKKKYNLAAPANAPDKGDKRSVEQWLDATRQR
jgi:hypothetical protein